MKLVSSSPQAVVAEEVGDASSYRWEDLIVAADALTAEGEDAALPCHGVSAASPSPDDTRSTAAVHFAGEATHDEFMGALHAAWLTGERAAHAILAGGLGCAVGVGHHHSRGRKHNQTGDALEIIATKIERDDKRDVTQPSVTMSCPT